MGYSSGKEETVQLYAVGSALQSDTSRGYLFLASIFSSIASVYLSIVNQPAEIGQIGNSDIGGVRSVDVAAGANYLGSQEDPSR